MNEILQNLTVKELYKNQKCGAIKRGISGALKKRTLSICSKKAEGDAL